MMEVAYVKIRAGVYDYLRNGRVGMRVLFREVLVCCQCMADCARLACSAVDWDRHVVDTRTGDCEHCSTCEVDELGSDEDEDDEAADEATEEADEATQAAEAHVEGETCHDSVEGHMCGNNHLARCGPCDQCEECYEDCCNSLDEDAHFARAHRMASVPLAAASDIQASRFSCLAGHPLDTNLVERHLASRQMVVNGAASLPGFKRASPSYQVVPPGLRIHCQVNGNVKTACGRERLRGYRIASAGQSVFMELPLEIRCRACLRRQPQVEPAVFGGNTSKKGG